MKNDNDIKATATVEKMAPSTQSGISDALRDTSRIVLYCDRADYSASRIARAVEDADVHVISLVMSPDTEIADRLNVDIRITSPSATAAVRSLERYGFEVIAVDSPRNDDSLPDDDTARQRALEVLRILDI